MNWCCQNYRTGLTFLYLMTNLQTVQLRKVKLISLFDFGKRRQTVLPRATIWIDLKQKMFYKHFLLVFKNSAEWREEKELLLLFDIGRCGLHVFHEQKVLQNKGKKESNWELQKKKHGELWNKWSENLNLFTQPNHPKLIKMLSLRKSKLQTHSTIFPLISVQT